MDFLDLVILLLATNYLAVILSRDTISGPRNILTVLRKRLGVRYNDYGLPEVAPGSLADLLLCPYCNSVWIALILCGLYALALAARAPARWLFLPLAAGGFVVLLQDIRSG